MLQSLHLELSFINRTLMEIGILVDTFHTRLIRQNGTMRSTIENYLASYERSRHGIITFKVLGTW
jgi:hypothetical protein